MPSRHKALGSVSDHIKHHKQRQKEQEFKIILNYTDETSLSNRERERGVGVGNRKKQHL